ncbi:MAG TPA: FHA domain-containing protein [Pyrinomonadaceae bacterium]|nr:FHA domain-containing protein [Pyrinomonadaceae bacterium]
MDATFIIVREDLQVDPVTIVAEGILVGRLPTCELLLNHPSVSRLQAGITNVEGDYYIRNFRSGNPILVNGVKFDGYEALTDGDVLGVGPFVLNIDLIDGLLYIKVSIQIGASPSDAVVRKEASGVWDLPATIRLPSAPLEGEPVPGVHKKPAARRPPPAPAGTKALDVFWDKRITAATKTVKPSPLFPLTGRPSGKAQSVWTPTTDLKRRWPWSVTIWAGVAVALLAGAGAIFYAAAFAPAPIADAHTRANLKISPPVANHANAGSCTSCHALTTSIDAKCSACHTTPAFAPTVIKPHADAGIGCAACHAEHRGAQFSAMEGALLSCTECHHDNNRNTYNGKSVSTPHGGTFGYPVINGQWKWSGLDSQALADRAVSLKLERLPTDDENQWRSKQFHALHLHRVRATAGMKGNKEGELSCSSCHDTRDPIDLVTPRTTCGKCHNGQRDPRVGKQVIASDKPNCTSCHVQHVKDKRHWSSGLMVKR